MSTLHHGEVKLIAEIVLLAWEDGATEWLVLAGLPPERPRRLTQREARAERRQRKAARQAQPSAAVR